MKRVERIKKNCEICEKEMLLTPYKAQTKRYCSNNCKYQWNLTQLREKDKVFKEKIKDMFGDKITLTSNYVGVKNKVSFICNVCNVTDELRADKILEGRGCKVCSSYKFTFDSVKQKIKEIHNDEYEILSDDFIDVDTPIVVRHKMCGRVYSTTSSRLLNGLRCLDCYGKRRRTTEEFIDMVNEINDDYEVLEDYKSNLTKIKMKHKKCNNEIYITPSSFIRGSRCSVCNDYTSRGEKEIEKILLDNNIKFEKQKKFKDLKYKHKLSYDFYLNNCNLCLEFNGHQHYKPIKFFGGEKVFTKQIIRDAIKQAYCEDNDIGLLIIPYWDYDNMKKIIINKINELGGIKNGI